MDKKFTRCIPELWGGIECSFNRVGDLFMDQLHYCGHYDRGEDDIARFASLGIKAMRYPLLWEKHQPSLQHAIDFRWTARQLEALRMHAIIPIAGLLHHGNGPAFTNLLHPSFPALFATYAKSVARKFPWLQYYTPINEPLTTARFTGLYGIWYPHKKSDSIFATIFLNQMKGVVMAMKAIREINPEARLLQTEDLCKTYSTPLLRYQADFENQRRWLTYDILCGLLRRDHPLWDFFVWLKIPQEALMFFQDNPCPPDIIGADHYLTSERFLDEEMEQYPSVYHGGNHQHRYADVEAIRVDHPAPSGLKILLKECWDRYQIPIAVTEVHLNGHPDDQIRWFKEVWDICRHINNEGIIVDAITVWSLLGSFGWNKLLTAPYGHYESGAFNLRNDIPEPTPLASFIKCLSEKPDYTHPAVAEKGWWQKPDRCLYNVASRCKPSPSERVDPVPAEAVEDVSSETFVTET